MYAYGLIVPILSFFLQVWPRFINRYFGVDTWRFLLVADYIRKNKRLPKSMTEKYILAAPFGYPPVIMILLAFFPRNFTGKFQFIFSPIFDSINNFLIFSATLLYTSNLKAAFFAQLIALSIPITVMEASNLTTRTLSYLIFYISFFPLIIFSFNHNLYLLFVASVGLFILFFTHKLAIQAYLFNVIGFSILENNLFYFAFFLAVFVSAFVLTGKLYKAIFEDHLVTLNNFRTYYDFRLHPFRKKNNESKKDFISKLYNLSFKNPLVYILGNNPWVAILLILYVFIFTNLLHVQSGINQHLFYKLNYWVFILLICGILILSVKKINFLGEGNRYIEYITLPLSVILGSFASSLFNMYGVKFITIFIIMLLGLVAGIVYLQIKVIVQDKYRTITDDLWKAIGYLRAHEDEKIRIAFFPTSLGDPVMYFVKGKALLTDSGKGVRKLIDILPVVSKPMADIVKKYNLNFIVIEESYVTVKELNLKNYKQIKKFGSYSVINL